MRQTHNKLVRDKIPEIIRQGGKKCQITTLSNTEYWQALQQKLLEEAQEVATAKPEDLVTELADLAEVIDTILKVKGIKPETVKTEQQRKKELKGGFKDKIKLEWVE